MTRAFALLALAASGCFGSTKGGAPAADGGGAVADGAAGVDGPSPGDARPGAVDARLGAVDGGSATVDASQGSPDGGGPELSLPVCAHTCSTRDDCSAGVAYMDGDNYACEAGACMYLGCNNDDECGTLGPYVCRPSGFGLPSCSHTCSTRDDCSAGVAYMDGDNYACELGACRYLGCNNDDECGTLGPYVCRPSDWGMPNCAHTCSTRDDCSAGVAYMDGDNYVCEGGACRYLGCNTDGECQTLGAYVCN